MTLPARRQTCPSCGRPWGRDASYCGACGALLGDRDPGTEEAAPPPVERSRVRWWATAATVAALAVAVLGLPGIGTGGPDGGDVDTDTIELPTEAPTAAPSGPVPLRCTQDRLVVDCLAWDVDAGGPISLGPRLDGGEVLVDHRPEAITVRDATTGEVRWRREDVGRAPPLRVAGDVLLVRAGPSTVAALDLDDGAERWRAGDVRSVGALPELGPDLAVLGRVGDDEVDGLVALDPATGEVAWEWTTPWDAPIASATQAVAPDVLLVTGGGRLARLDATTGATTWDVETLPGGYLQAQPPDHVSVQQLTEGDDPRLWIHDVATGTRVLEMPAARVASHLVAGARLVVHAPAEGVVRAHDLTTGEEQWHLLLDGGPGALGFPATATAPRDALVVLERGQRRVTRLDPGTGDPLWSVRLQVPPARSSTGGTFLGTPAILDDVVVVEDTSSIVTVLDLATGEERVRVAGAPDLDVRSLEPLTLVEGSRWVAVEVPPAGTAR